MALLGLGGGTNWWGWGGPGGYGNEGARMGAIGGAAAPGGGPIPSTLEAARYRGLKSWGGAMG